MNRCPKCGDLGILDFDYDALFCPVHLIWLDEKCEDDCELCAKRPEFAPRVRLAEWN